MCSDDLKDLLFYGGGTLDQIYSQTANDDSDEGISVIFIEFEFEYQNKFVMFRSGIDSVDRR